MSTITVVGGGYVGLITAACFARLGHRVHVVEIDPRKLEALRAGKLPIREPGLPEIWEQGSASGLLSVTASYKEAIAASEFAFLAVGTPSRTNGSADLRQVVSAVRTIIGASPGALPVIVVKSTVPPGTTELVRDVMVEHRPYDDVRVVSNPEFLREGLAVIDFMRPSRIVVGSDDREAAEMVGALYEKLHKPIIYTTTRSAEMIKYASNAFLCTKVSFINEIASLCEEIGVDVVDVSKALGMDPRIGNSYLEAGLGWGGSCLPKDIAGLAWTANRVGVQTPILNSAMKINTRQGWLVVCRLKEMIGDLRGKTIGVLGLAFKPNCDDIRESPALHLIQALIAEGCEVRAYDPMAMESAAHNYPEIMYCTDAYGAATGVDAIVLATAWPQFQAIDLHKMRALMKRPLLMDARNALDVTAVTDAGLIYAGIGRPMAGPEFEQPQRELAQHLRATRGRPRTRNTNGKQAAA
jgi:UDPglucose 6-dehydrogenase